MQNHYHDDICIFDTGFVLIGLRFMLKNIAARFQLAALNPHTDVTLVAHMACSL